MDIKIDKFDRKYKQIYDSIHGYICISNISCQIIDTIEFQRLRELHQLGTCYLVFPNASNSRFEHSIGVYHLSGKLLNYIISTSSIIDVKMTNEYLNNIVELKKHYKLKEYNNELLL